MIVWRQGVVAAALMAAACGPQASPTPERKGPPPAAVAVATATKGTLPVTVRTVGNVESVSQVTLRPQVAGQIVEVAVEEGADVQADAVLIKLDERPFEAALKEAQAHLARDRAMSADDRRMADRFAAAQASNAANKTEAEASEAKAAASEAQVDADDAEVRTAKLNLEYCEIKAPFAGRLGTVLVRKGAITKANETDLVTVVQMLPIQIGFSVPERYVEAIRAGQTKSPLKVTANVAGDAHGIVGEVNFIDNRVDMTTGTIRLKGLYANKDERLWPGQFVDVVLTLAEEEGVMVPAEAVLTSQKGRAVWVVKADQTAEMRQVKVRRQVGNQTVLDTGVEAGETVVTDGQLRLAPGSKVEIKTAASATAPTGGLGE